MAIQSITINHKDKKYKVYKGPKGGIYIVRKTRKVYLQNGSGDGAGNGDGVLGILRSKATKRFGLDVS